MTVKRESISFVTAIDNGSSPPWSYFLNSIGSTFWTLRTRIWCLSSMAMWCRVEIMHGSILPSVCKDTTSIVRTQDSRPYVRLISISTKIASQQGLFKWFDLPKLRQPGVVSEIPGQSFPIFEKIDNDRSCIEWHSTVLANLDHLSDMRCCWGSTEEEDVKFEID